MPGPLEGFRILDVCRAGPGQMATGMLADYGADVITIVEPGLYERRTAGGANAPEHGRVNMRNKRSLFLNLRVQGGKEVFLRLVKDVDAVLESNRPGVVKRLGIDFEAVRAVNPGIVYCSLSGFGQTGPWAGVAAHDLSYQGIAGMVPLNEDDTPRMPAYNRADLQAAWSGAMAVLMALLRRERSGHGQFIDVSFTDVSVTIPPGRMADEGLRGQYPHYQIYETKDGRYLTLSTREPWFWERVCKMMGREDWIPHIRPTGALRDEMFAFFRGYFKGRNLEEWLTVMREHDLQFGPVNRTGDELLADPQLMAREMVIESRHPATGERMLQPGFAFKFSETPGELRWGPQPMGATSAEVLREIGYSAEEVETLRKEGVTG